MKSGHEKKTRKRERDRKTHRRNTQQVKGSRGR
jgi:hypothetical protein